MTEEKQNDNRKIVENKETVIPFNEDRKANYADLIKSIVDLPMPKEGLSMDTMRKNFQILDIIEKGGEQLVFTSEQLDIIKNNVENSVWTVQHKDLVLFADYINSL